MKKNNISKLTITAMLSVLNIVGGYIALTLKLPIYIDSMGTILSAILFGPLYAILAALVSGVISGITADYFALFFIPASISIGILTHFVNKKNLLSGWKIFIGVFIITIISSLIASSIAAYLFEGVTSSGSSYIARCLYAKGFNLLFSVFITQFFTDYVDKLISVILMVEISKKIKRVF